MLRDMKYSSDLMNEFKVKTISIGTNVNFFGLLQEQHSDNTISTLLHLEVNVLTYGFWPSYTPINVTLPRHVSLSHVSANYMISLTPFCYDIVSTGTRGIQGLLHEQVPEAKVDMAKRTKCV